MLVDLYKLDYIGYTMGHNNLIRPNFYFKFESFTYNLFNYLKNK